MQPGIAMDADCQLKMKHCWKTEMDTKSIFYRCFPLYEENVTTVEICANPKGAKVDDPSCSKKIVTEVKETEAPSKKSWRFYAILCRFIKSTMDHCRLWYWWWSFLWVYLACFITLCSTTDGMADCSNDVVVVSRINIVCIFKSWCYWAK